MSPSAALNSFPLAAERTELLSQLVRGLDTPGLLWISGYTAGLARAGVTAGMTGGAMPAIASPARDVQTDGAWLASIVYGSQTGNGRHIAEALADQLLARGLRIRLLRAGEYPLRELARERRLFVVMSTQGDGDPPDDARAMTDFLFSRRAPRLEALEYSVLALGDSSYPRYCEIGRRVDERLAELGARRILDRIDCDVDFGPAADAWKVQAAGSLHKLSPEHAGAKVAVLRAVPDAAPYDRARPFVAEVLANQRITIGEGVRDMRHVELSLAGSGLSYEPGDALGVVAENPPQTVQAVLDAARLDASQQAMRDGRSQPLSQWLSTELEITRVTRSMLVTIARRGAHADLAALLEPGQESALRALMSQTQLPDLLVRYPADWDAASLVGTLRPLVPRLYSIASSASEVGEEVHIAVARIGTGGGSPRPGAASHFLATRPDAALVPVYVESNPRFRLPAPDRDIVMIGAGSGVAPYRAFLQDRVATGARGRNWLIFGARHFSQDFLYQLEWQRALKRGTLARIDLAFSRDRHRHAYVQHRICEAGAVLHDWIEGGATVYVCGDAARMAPDVDRAIADVMERHGGMSAEAAREHLSALGAEGRYLRDVY